MRSKKEYPHVGMKVVVSMIASIEVIPMIFKVTASGNTPSNVCHTNERRNPNIGRIGIMPLLWNISFAIKSKVGMFVLQAFPNLFFASFTRKQSCHWGIIHKLQIVNGNVIVQLSS